MPQPKPILNNPNFTAVDETDDYIVVEKPAPLLVHPSTPHNPPSLWDGLRHLLAFEIANGGQVSIINRLDRETSGLVLVAKKKEIARHFSMMMQERRIEKAYLALVWGWPAEDRFTVDEPMLRKGEITPSPIWLKQAVHPSGASARTDFEVVDRISADTTNGSRFSLVRCRPATGRMHQIRVHLSHYGHAVVGDKIYGPDENCYLRFIETGWTDDLRARLLLPRHALHSSHLKVPAPGGRSTLCWNSPAPPEFSLKARK